MKKGLVMEGGGMRGMFTCGVIDVLMEKGITFDGAGGISAGAVFGCNFKSHQIGRPIRYNKNYCKDKRYKSIRSLVMTGDLYGVDFCYRELPDELDPFDRKAFRENPMAFYVGATDVNTGCIVYHQCTDGGETDMQWMRASASMPLVSRVVEVGGRQLLDGGVVEPTPYFYMKEMGYDRNVVILTQPREYRKEQSAAMPLIAMAMRKYPKLVEAMKKRYSSYNAHIAAIREEEKAGVCLVICPPSPLPVHRTESDPEKLDQAYRIGRTEAQKQLETIYNFLKEDGNVKANL
ncbi:MAG: patatin family protein [Clostridia bacterium]|nr:patatin family protein [Clostridia bacterium]